MNFKRHIRRYIYIILMITLLLTLTGCNEYLTSFMETDLRDMITSRITANQVAATQLYNAGLMTELEYTTVMKALADKETQLIKANEGDSSSQTAMFAALSSFRQVEWKESYTENGKKYNREGYEKDNWNDYMVPNAIIKNFSNIPGKENLNILNGTGTVVPISIIDETTGTDINKRFGFPIYVLKTAENLGGAMTQVALDEISEMINQAISDPKNIDFSVLDTYFTQVKNSSGNAVTLLDTTKRENKIVVVSDGTLSSYVASPDDASVPNKVMQSQKDNLTFPGNIYVNKPGKDMIIKQEGYPIMSIRFREFNQSAIDNVIKTLGLSDDKYLVAADGAGGRVYLLEYPVHYIKTFKENGDSYESVFNQSNLGINLKTGDFVKYEGAWNESKDEQSLSGKSTIKDDPYLTLGGAVNNLDTAKASFSLYGNMKLKLGEKNTEVSVGRVILKDYLEATYAPGVVPGENVVVFGRKIRIENFEGRKDTVVAYYYDKSGNRLDIGGRLEIQDFADIEKLTSGNASVQFIKGYGQEDYERGDIPDEDDNVDDLGSTSGGSVTNEELMQSSINKIDNLPIKTVTEIRASMGFPSKYIGRVDNHESETPYFYTMAIKRGMFETGLFSGWIYQTDAEGNSLKWWNDWLESHGYEYRIDKAILEDFLAGNYAYELGQQGILVLDLETISKIQQEYEEQDVYSRNRTIRTMFILLGAILIGYSLIMLLAWVLDTNVDFGFNILEKMTFGQLIAVSDESEVPQIDTESRRYIGFGNLVIKAFIITVIGIVIIIVDFMEIGYWLIQVFGGIAKFISRIFNSL